MSITRPRHRKRVANRTLLREFERGLSFIGLARKYGLTNREVQDRVRKACTLWR